MASSAILKAILLLRIFTLIALAASILVMVFNTSTIDGSKIRFTIFVAYRYVFSACVIVLVYTLIQIPFSIYNVVHDKRWICGGCLPEFDFYGDKVMAFLLASGIGFGFGVTWEVERDFDGCLGDDVEKFLNRGYISCGLMLLGFVSMAILTIFSSDRHPGKRMFK